MTDKEREEYNSEPVWYCKDCLSLKIINLTEDQCFCDTCGNMDVDQTTIEEWEKLYENKYKHKYIENGRKRSYYVWADNTRRD